MDFLRNLYNLEESSIKISDYIRKEENSALSIIGIEESKSLSAFYLSSDNSFLNKDMIPSYIERGILEKKHDGALEITEIGLKAVSLYPLLGIKKENRRHYDMEFFPMLLSLIASGDVPSKRKLWTKFFSSEDFISIFPRRNRDRITKAAVKSIESLLRLSVAEENGSYLFLRKEPALLFAALSEESKLSYILYPDANDEEIREKAAYLIHLAMKTEGIKAEDIDSHLAMLSKIADCRIDKELLFMFDVLHEENGQVSGADIVCNRTEDALISSDFTLSYTGFTPTPLFMYFKAEKDDNITQWKVTKESIIAAFDLGCTLKNVIYIMKGMSNQRPPAALIPRIESWYDGYSAIKIKRSVILEADEKNAKLIEKLPDMQMHILSHPSSTLFMMDCKSEKLWRSKLISYGFDKLGRTEGPSFTEEKENPRFISYGSLKELPPSRAIEFSEDMKAKVNSTSESLLDSLLTEEGIRFRADQHFKPFLAYGFNYYEKLNIINSAIKSNMRIYAELADKREFVFTPIAIIKEDDKEEHYVKSERGNMIPVCILYRLSAIDRIIRDQV